MNKNILLLLFIIVTHHLFATPQPSDYLIYKGEKYEWRGGGYGDILIERTKLSIPKEAVETTGTNRIVWLTYIIENDKLYLIDIEAYTEGEIFDYEFNAREIVVKSFFSYYFPNQDKILISGVDGVILIPFGETGKDEYCFIKSKNYHLFYFVNGVLKNTKTVDYEGLQTIKKMAFIELKSTSNYKKVIRKWKEDYILFNEYNCKEATIDEYLEYHIFSRGLINRLD